MQLLCVAGAHPLLCAVQPKFQRRWNPPLTEQDRKLPWWHERFKVKHLDDYDEEEGGYEGDADEPLLHEDLDMDLEGPLARQLAVSTWAIGSPTTPCAPRFQPTVCSAGHPCSQPRGARKSLRISGWASTALHWQ